MKDIAIIILYLFLTGFMIITSIFMIKDLIKFILSGKKRLEYLKKELDLRVEAANKISKAISDNLKPILNKLQKDCNNKFETELLNNKLKTDQEIKLIEEWERKEKEKLMDEFLKKQGLIDDK